MNNDCCRFLNISRSLVFAVIIIAIILTIAIPLQATEKKDGTDSFTGIGVSFWKIQGHIMITFLIDGSPAKEAGLKAGDIIVAVDDKPVDKIEAEAVRNLLLGKKETVVKVSVVKPSNMAEKRDFFITRREITYAEAKKGESPNFSGSELKINIGFIEPSTVSYPYGDSYQMRQLAAINISAPGAQSYEAYILDKDKNIVKRVYIEEGEYLGNGLEQQAKWGEEIYDDPAENINSPSGKYIFTIKCFGYDGRTATADKEFEIDVNPPVLVLHDKNIIVSDGRLVFSADKDVYIKLGTYDEYGNTLEAINNEDRLYGARAKQKIELKNKDKIRYVWLKATDKYGNTSAKVVSLASVIPEKVKEYYLIKVAGSIDREAIKNKEYTNYYNEILLKSRELLGQKAPLKALLLLRACEERHPYEDVAYDYCYVKKGFGAMAQMEIARIYAEYLNDYEKGIEEYRKAIEKYKEVEVGFIQASRGPWGQCGIFSLFEIAKIYCNDLINYQKALIAYHDYLRIYKDQWEELYENADSFDLRAFNSLVNIAKVVYGDGERTIAECNKVITETKNDAMACEAYLKIAETCIDDGKYNAAIDAYAKIINRYPAAQITFPYDSALNYATLAGIKTLDLYQNKLKDKRRAAELAGTLIRSAKEPALIDLAYKRLDELLPADRRAVREILLDHDLLKDAEKFRAYKFIEEKGDKLAFLCSSNDLNSIYSINLKDALRDIKAAGNDRLPKTALSTEAGMAVPSQESEFFIEWNDRIHAIVRRDRPKEIVYSTNATIEQIADFTIDKANLYVLHRNYVMVENRNDHKRHKIFLNDRKNAWPGPLWLSPDSRYLIVLNDSAGAEYDLKRNSLKVIGLDGNGDAISSGSLEVRGQIKDIIFLGDKYFLINEERVPFSYKFQDDIPCRIEIYELPTLKNVSRLYVNGDAKCLWLSKVENSLWVLSTRKRLMLSLVDLKKILK